jgi:hypothetical protein
MRVFTIQDEKGYVRAYTKVSSDDWSDEELSAEDIVEARLEAAMEDGYLPNESFEIREAIYKDREEMKEDLRVLKYLETHWNKYDRMMGKQSTPYVIEI